MKISKIQIFQGSEQPNPPVVISPLTAVNVIVDEFFSIPITTKFSPTSFNILNYTQQVSATNNGIIYGKMNVGGLHQIGYEVINESGKNTFCLTLNAMTST
jgi:hypothetical protein